MAMLKGLKVLAICWGLAIATAFIPIVHFVSVPVLVLVGPVAFFVMKRMYTDKTDVHTPGAQCPGCGDLIHLPISLEEWPVHFSCNNCQMKLTAEVS